MLATDLRHMRNGQGIRQAHDRTVLSAIQLMSQFLDSRHLRLVAEVAHTESVTRAADRLNVTQSAVSHQLRELEGKLGTPIFVRSGRRMLLTPAGRLLVEAAGHVLDAIGEVEAKVSQLARNIAGELRVSRIATPDITGCPRW